MVQQLHPYTKAQWQSKAMPRLARLNQALVRPVHRGPTHNDMFPKLNNVKYLSVIDVNSGYYSLKLDERSSYSQHSCVSLAGIDTKDCNFGSNHRQYVSAKD